MADDAQINYINLLHDQIKKLKKEKEDHADHDAVAAENAALKQTIADQIKTIAKLKQALAESGKATQKKKQIASSSSPLKRTHQGGVGGGEPSSQQPSSSSSLHVSPPTPSSKQAPMSLQLKCAVSNCETLSHDRDSLSAHFKDRHEDSYKDVAFAGVDGIIRKDINRNPQDGLLHCPCNNFQSPLIRSFRNHAKECNGIPQSNSNKRQKLLPSSSFSSTSQSPSSSSTNPQPTTGTMPPTPPQVQPITQLFRCTVPNCIKSDVTFNHERKLKFHTRDYHIPSVKIKFLGHAEETIILRDEVGKLRCPCRQKGYYTHSGLKCHALICTAASVGGKSLATLMAMSANSTNSKPKNRSRKLIQDEPSDDFDSDSDDSETPSESEQTTAAAPPSVPSPEISPIIIELPASPEEEIPSSFKQQPHQQPSVQPKPELHCCWTIVQSIMPRYRFSFEEQVAVKVGISAYLTDNIQNAEMLRACGVTPEGEGEEETTLKVPDTLLNEYTIWLQSELERVFSGYFVEL